MCQIKVDFDHFYAEFFEGQISNYVTASIKFAQTSYLDRIHDETTIFKQKTCLNPLEFVAATENQWQSLVSWLLEIQKSYDLSYSVLYISANLLDKVLCLRALRIGQLQPYAAVCILIASMHEGPYPAMQELVYLCDGLCSTRKMQSIISDVLAAVEYKIEILDPRTAAGVILSQTKQTSEQGPSDEFYCALNFVLSVSLINRSAARLPPFDFADAALRVVAKGLNAEGNEPMEIVSLGVSTYMKMHKH